MRRLLKTALTAAVAALILGWGGSAQAGKVYLIKVNGAIGPVTAMYISRAIDKAEDDAVQCLVLQMDTPGGMLDSTKDIVMRFLAAKVPIVVYVAPSGASAGSAGCFIVIAADIAAMAPTTNIGAAHPVQMGGVGGEKDKEDDVMKQKMASYASSYIEAIATKRKRNVEWARSSVTESKSIPAETALKTNVIDLIATDMPDLLKQIDGRSVNGKVLATSGAQVVEIQPSTRENILNVVLHPSVMFILVLIAMYGIIGELSNPGAILPGVAGAIAVVLLLFMNSVLPMNITGLALIGVAVVLFVADVFASTHGVLTVGGIVAFFLGSLMLFEDVGPAYRLSMSFIVPATLVTALFFAFVVGSGLYAQFMPNKVGKEAMIGQIVRAYAPIDDRSGTVTFEGEFWNAVSDTPVAAGQDTEIVGVKGLLLKVKPVTKKENVNVV